MSSLKDLRSQARTHGIRGYSSMRKEELQAVLANVPVVVRVPTTEEIVHPEEPLEVTETESKSPEVQEEPKKLVRGIEQKPLPFDRMTNKGLRDIAKQRGLKRYSKLKKEDLVDLLS